jgi:hypothetical protein
MFHYYSMNREEYMGRYHKRSNVESVFSMIKAKFRDDVRSKSNVAMVNEVLCKILAHNLCCLIMSQFELGIEPVFWGKEGKEETKGEPVTVAPVVTAIAVKPVSVKATVAPVLCGCAGA